MPKRKNKKTSNKNNPMPKFRILRVFLLVFLFTVIASSFSYFVMHSEKINKNNQETVDEKDKDSIKKYQEKKLNEYSKIVEDKKQDNTAYEEYTQEFNKDFIYTPPKEVEQKDEKKPKEQNYNFLKKSLYKYDKNTKPKIAIVIDDVSNRYQKRDILDIGYKVNMSFLPPTNGHRNSANIAQDLPFHMIHFPMQASSKFNRPEKDTLNITDSYEKIEKRVKQLRQWYPNAIYTNNHTGSVFTKDYDAMDKLFKALKKYNFIFVDSRTTSQSVAKKLAKKHDMPYIVRNTFIDNKKEFGYIQNQLKKAIYIAKKRGYAIAIGHPYSITIDVLKKSKHLLKDLEIIYINELPYL
ncbi:MAG: divergent polysaccharide deacetylase family protein [Campylobacterota bacterium]